MCKIYARFKLIDLSGCDDDILPMHLWTCRSCNKYMYGI